jgi:hypothetical protein
MLLQSNRFLILLLLIIQPQFPLYTILHLQIGRIYRTIIINIIFHAIMFEQKLPIFPILPAQLLHFQLILLALHFYRRVPKSFCVFVWVTGFLERTQSGVVVRLFGSGAVHDRTRCKGDALSKSVGLKIIWSYGGQDWAWI